MGGRMHSRTLGRTGMTVSTHCLGAMMFGSWGNPDHDQSTRMIHTALDSGINFVDTADVYSAGESEEIVGKALAGRRDDVVLATKVHAPMGADPNQRGNSRRWITREIDNSLRRLQTDWIDLYQIHRPDFRADIDDTLGALSDLVHQGKVRAIGSSTFPAELIVEAQWVAERRARERFVCEQPPYSIFARGIERAVLPTRRRRVPAPPADGFRRATTSTDPTFSRSSTYSAHSRRSRPMRGSRSPTWPKRGCWSIRPSPPRSSAHARPSTSPTSWPARTRVSTPARSIASTSWWSRAAALGRRAQGGRAP